MKILYAITRASWGGSQRYLFDIATAAQARGHEVVVAAGEAGELIARLEGAGIRTVVCTIHNKASLGAMLHAKQELRKVFAQEKPDVVHLNSSLVGIGGALAARTTKVPRVIFTDHGWAFKEARSLPQRAAIWLISWATALLVDTVIAVSDAELALTRQMPFVGKKAVRIYNGIDLRHALWLGRSHKRCAFPAGAQDHRHCRRPYEE
jgi:glycosyltransferase involved in cell wall biosynthesis